MFCPVSPVVLHNHGPFIITKTKIGSLLLMELNSLFRVHKFSLNVLFLFHDLIQGYHLTLSLWLPPLLWSITISQTFPVIDDMKFLKNPSQFLQKLSLVLFSVFSCLHWSHGFGGERLQK